MTDARVLRFPAPLGPCPQCGWRHPDPKIKLLRWCPECDQSPLYPWTCPNCHAKHEATAHTIIGWSVGRLEDGTRPEGATGMNYICSECGPGMATPEGQAQRRRQRYESLQLDIDKLLGLPEDDVDPA